MTTTTHFDVLAAAIGVPLAKDALRELREAGYIIVRKGAIGQAQREAYYEALEDVRMGLVRADNGNEPQRQAA